MPSQLSKKNKNFLHQTIETGARAKKYGDALNWLVNADRIYKIFATTKPSLPLMAYDYISAFKVYMNDVGLLRKLSNIDPSAYGEGNRLLTEFKGAFAENFILSGLINKFEVFPPYWHSDGTTEVEFLLQHRNQIVPIEVKSDENIKSKSLSDYRQKFNPAVSVRLSLRNIQKDNNLIDLSLLKVDYLDKFLTLNTD